jgi:hypothetical protein
MLMIAALYHERVLRLLRAALQTAAGRSLTPSQKAIFGRTLALLRWDQGSGDEAAALLDHAARLFAEDSLPGEQGVTLAVLGLLHVEGAQWARAAALLRRARRLLEVEGEREDPPGFRRRIEQALALAERGGPEVAMDHAPRMSQVIAHPVPFA